MSQTTIEEQTNRFLRGEVEHTYEEQLALAIRARAQEDGPRRILRGESPPPPREVLRLAKELKESKSFTLARRLLGRALLDPAINDDPRLKLQIHQQAAVCTYKDMDLPADSRLDRALELLRVCEPLEATKNQETLGIAGAIYKRKFEVDSQRRQLERSLGYY